MSKENSSGDAKATTNRVGNGRKRSVNRIASNAKTRRQRLLLELLENRLTMASDMADSLQPSVPGVSVAEPEFEISTIEWNGKSVEVKAGSWLVSMKEDSADAIDFASLVRPRMTLAQSIEAVAGRAPSAELPVLQRSLGNRQLAIQTPIGWSTESVYSSLVNLPGIRFAEPDFILRTSSTLPNDPMINSLYALEKSSIYEAWDTATGSSSVVVGVIDSGVDYTHPDLIANMWRNPGEIPGDGIDNDRNGYRDDVYGYDFINGDGDPMDDNGHGTHVAGTIAAVGNNGVGVAGVSWNAKVMALKFLGSNGSGPTSAAASALNYATLMKTRYGVNIRITNNSWGGGAYSQTMADALAANANADMLFVAAAGNAASNNDSTVSYPSGYASPNIIAVASSTSTDTLSSFSNFGAASVDIAAPGSSIHSTLRGGGYGAMSGTSMASPQVAGAAALLLGATPNATYQQVRDALYESVDVMPEFTGKVATNGRLNVSSALNRMLGDVGDTLALARTTSLDQNGDRFVMNSSKIGDGSHAAQDVDLYRIQATAGSQLSAELLAVTNGLDGNRILKLFSSNGVELAVADSPSSNEARLSFEFVSTGTYFIGVSSGENSAYNVNQASSGSGTVPVDYRLQLSLDVGDLLVSAKQLSLPTPGTTYQYNVRIGDGVQEAFDVDLYRFTLASGTVVNAISKPKSGGDALNAVLRLFDATGNQIAVSDPASRDDAGLTYRATTAGDYYLGVSGSGNKNYSATTLGLGSFGDQGDYSLTLTTSRTVAESDAELDLHAFLGADGSRGFVIHGQDEYAELTGPSSSRNIGDVNGDQVDDFIVSVTGDIGVGPMGMVYLVFGRKELGGGFPAELDVTSLDGTNGYRLEGIQLFDRTGLFGGGAGDMNGDGLLDIVIGAIAASPTPDRNDAGQTYVLFGGELANVDALDGATDGLIRLANLNGANGFTINAAIAGGLGGRSSSAGDFNADGFDDVIIGAPGVNSSTGEAYVVFGRTSFPPVVDVATLNGIDGLTILGPAVSSTLGISVGDAGDLNGDGIDDVFVSASSFDTPTLSNAGAVYIFYGSTAYGRSGAPATLSVSGLNGSNGFVIEGTAASDLLGGSVSKAGDVNGDGRSDLLIGASGYDLPDRTTAGAVYVVQGRSSSQSPFPALIPASAIENNWGTLIIGASAGMSLSGTGLGGDFDGDGINEIVVVSSSADPNGISNAGQTFLIYGSRLLPGRIDTASLLVSGGGDGVTGRVFNGYLDGSGMRSSMIGDVNKDGFDDLRIGLPYADVNGLIASGQINVVYGTEAKAGVRYSASDSLVTTEGGGTASVKVALSRRPSAPVTIPLAISDATEGAISVNNLVFDANNWNTPQTIVVRGVDDTAIDGSVAYSLILLPIVSDDPNYSGMNPRDFSFTNTDNDAPVTQFYVVNDAQQNRTFEYSSTGTLIENYALGSANSTPRGIVTSPAGDRVWVVDSNRTVFVYSPSGVLLGSWSAGSMPSNAQPEGIATNGTDIWIVDNRGDRVYRYAGAVTRLTGSQAATGSFPLASGNTNPKDIVTDGVSIWTVNDASADRVYKYSLNGNALGNWSIDTLNSQPTGLALDPANPSSIWIVDAGRDRLYRYDASASRVSGSQSASLQFALNSGNLSAQGVAFAPSSLPAQQSVMGDGEPAIAKAANSSQSAKLLKEKAKPDSTAERIDDLYASEDVDWLHDSLGSFGF